MYVEIPAVEGTTASRIIALRESRDLLKEEASTAKASIFGGESHNPGSVAGPAALIRLATYIETGHDYKDTHPEGKRRPIIKHIANVTIVAPEAPDEEDINHLLHHLFNGDFDQPEPETADAEKSADPWTAAKEAQARKEAGLPHDEELLKARETRKPGL